MRVRLSQALRLSGLLAVAAAGLSQVENQAYFSLSSTRTFASNSKPQINLSAWNVDSLEFRVYRIEDPSRFFEQLEDPHAFGQRAPQPPRERTVLEELHQWKRG